MGPLGTTRSTTRLPVLAHGRVAVREARADRRAFAKLCPKRPGVYAMLDERGTILYVGKSRCLRARLASYLRADHYGDKAFRIITAAHTLVWEVLPDEFGTLLREIELIKLWQPRYNVQYHPSRRRHAYLALNAGPLPSFRVLLERPKRRDALAVMGPLPAKRRLGDAAELLNDLFRLRTCDGDGSSPLFDRPGCMRADLGTCLAPCLSGHDAAAYAAAAQSARRFLAGRDLSLLRELKAAMQAAADALNFEAAARHRDRWALLRWLRRRAKELARARLHYNFVYELPCDGDDARVASWYLVRSGRVAACTAAPVDAPGRLTAAALLARVYGEGAKARAPLVDGPDSDTLAMVVAWFRTRPDDLARALPVGAALAACCGEAPSVQPSAP